MTFNSYVYNLTLKDSETTDRSANDEKELVTPPASKYGEKFVFEKSYPLVTSDRKTYDSSQWYVINCFCVVCKQLQHAIDNVRILRLKNLNLGEYLPDGLLEVSHNYNTSVDLVICIV